MAKDETLILLYLKLFTRIITVKKRKLIFIITFFLSILMVIPYMHLDRVMAVLFEDVTN